MNSILDVSFEHDGSVVARRAAGEFVLVPVTPGKSKKDLAIYTLDSVAAFLWEQMDGKQTGRDLATSLVKKYEVDSHRAEKDIQVFLKELQEIEAILPAVRK